MWMDPGQLRKLPLRRSVPGPSAITFAKRTPHEEAGLSASMEERQ